MLIITIVNVAASVVGILNLTLFPWVRPFIVIVISILVAFVRISLKDKIRVKIKG